MQDALEATARRLAVFAALLVATLAVSAATAPNASAACGVTGPLVCVDVAGSSATVSPSTQSLTGLLPTFVSYDVTITNQAKSTVTHVALSDAVAGGTLVSTAPSTGTCTPDGAQCTFGSVPSGGRVTATITVRAPLAEGQIANTATVSFDEAFNDGPTADPKQDTVAATATTLVQAVAGEAASLVPSGQEVQLDTDPTHADATTPQDANIGHARVPASAHPAINATLNEETAPFSCPKKVICRTGAWLHADIPGTFTPALEFTLHWNKVLVLPQQSVKNLAVLHTACLTGCAIEVISARCSSSNPAPAELPCLSDVVETASEFRATLHSRTNGYMR